MPSGPGRRRRWLVFAGVLGVLLVAAGVVAAVVVRQHPGAPARVRALAAGGVRRAAALIPGGEPDGAPSVARPGRLACVPAVVGGAPGALRTVADVGVGERITVLWHWAADAGDARAEHDAVRAAAAARGLAVVPVGSGHAVAVTGPGEVLRAINAQAPGAAVVVPSAGSSSVCVLD